MGQIINKCFVEYGEFLLWEIWNEIKSEIDKGSVNKFSAYFESELYTLVLWSK